MLFSEKYGYTSPKIFQIQSISTELRNRIWNLFYKREITSGGLSSQRITQAINGESTIDEKIMDRFGFSIISTSGPAVWQQLQEKVLKGFTWYQVYDYISVYLSFLDGDEKIKRMEEINSILQEENAGYRVALGEIVPITNEEEIHTIEKAGNSEFESVKTHINKALNLFADLTNPDYENSIKESISAVEAMCCIITGITGTQATLGAALKKLKENGIHIHSAMEKAFSSLYGYTSDENGIRHGGIDFKNAPAEDAKFMLVACSAFINYLIEKWTKVNSRG